MRDLSERIAKLEALDAKRTPGEWNTYTGTATFEGMTQAGEFYFYQVCTSIERNEGRTLATVHKIGDAEYMAQMPEAMAVIRELAAEVERLRGIIEFNGLSGEL